MRAKSACPGLRTKFDSIPFTAKLGTRSTAVRAFLTQVSPNLCESGISFGGEAVPHSGTELRGLSQPSRLAGCFALADCRLNRAVCTRSRRSAALYLYEW
jgi:hypothetical protein